MTHTRRRTTAIGLAAAVAAGFTVAPAVAQAASTGTFYVDSSSSSSCDDAGQGTQADPFCTIQAAANAATAGDTVYIENALTNYEQPVTISHSGTASAPITFESSGLPLSVIQGPVTVSGSYVDFDDVDLAGVAQPVTVTGSHVTFDGDEIGGEAAALKTGADVSDLTVEHSFVSSFGGTPGIELGSGNSGAVISTNVFNDGFSGATDSDVTVSGDSGTDVTGNTFVGDCDDELSVTGSTGTSIENNVFGQGSDCNLDSGTDILSVDPASAASTIEGYNVLDTVDGSATPYVWAGHTYTTQAAFAAASGQGTADSVVDAFDTGTDSYSGDTVAEGTANANAPGESATDLYGNAWSGTPDRGAIDLEEFTAANLYAVNASAQEVEVDLDLQGIAWGPTAHATIDWGDGSSDQTLSTGDMANDFSALSSYHMYTQRGTYTVTATIIDATQTVTKTVTVTADGSTYVPITPTRVLDTRKGKGAPLAPVAKYGTLALNVTNGVTLPAGMGTITAVVLNVTVTGPKSGGFLSVYPAGTSLPSTSSLNFTQGETVPNLVTVKVGAGNEVDLYNGSPGTTDLVADVEGYYVDSSAGSEYLPNTPDRLLDTRTTTGGHDAPVPANGNVTISVPTCTEGTGPSAVTATATAAAVNLTVTKPQDGGYLVAYPEGGTEPTASNVNFSAGETVPNMSVVETGQNGGIVIHNSSPGTVDVVADLAGCYSATLGDPFVPITPYRALDTRSGLGQESATGIAAQANSNAVWWTSDDPIVPDNGQAGPTAVVMNVTVTDPKSGGVITAYPTGSARPTASNLNFGPGETVPNLVMVAVDSDFGLALYNQSGGTAELIADYYGYFS